MPAKLLLRFVPLSILFVNLNPNAVNAQHKELYNQKTEYAISSLIKKMSLAEKVGMIHASSSFTSGGVKRLGIPELVTSDGPHGVRPEHGRGWTLIPNVNDAGTYLPTGNTLAATWNPKLGYEFGAVLGSEAKYRGKDVILAPGINIIRSPLNGRNFEYLSEDPFLISKMVVGYIRGIQDQGISACLKHYAANNEEVDRNTVNVEMSERALREIYLPGFKAAVTLGHVNTVMGAYNKFRGQYATENDYLINKVLKGEWGFKGLLMSDWGAVHDTREALINGTDLEMGSDLEPAFKKYNQFYLADTVIALIKAKKVHESLVDEKVRRILRVMFKTNMINGKRTPGTYNTLAHQQTALKVAEEGIVLLKNQENLLPLDFKKIRRLAVIGENAERLNAMGGGSSQVKAKYEISPIQGLRNELKGQTEISFAQGYRIARGQHADPEMIKEAVEAAAHAEAAIIFCGWTHGYDYNVWEDNAYDAEGADKPSLKMPFGQDELIEAVLKANPKTVIVLMGGGPIDIQQWESKCHAIVEGWYPGMEGGNALAGVLSGRINPSGKLPMTFPKKLEDSPAHKLGEFPGINGTVHYNEGVFVGYRYFDTYNVEPQYAFGHGLSYTSFAFTHAKVKKSGSNQAEIEFTLTNTGKVAGAEVAQIYIHQVNPSVSRPDKELKGFQKVYLQPGESKKVTKIINGLDLAYYNENEKSWVTESGAYQVLIGSSSRDIKIKKVIHW